MRCRPQNRVGSLLRWAANNVSFLGPDELPQTPGAIAPQTGWYPSLLAKVANGTFLLPLEVAWALDRAQAPPNGSEAGAVGGALARAAAAARSSAAGWVSELYAPTSAPGQTGTVQGNASRFVRTLDARFGYQVFWVRPGQVVDIALQNTAALNGECVLRRPL